MPLYGKSNKISKYTQLQKDFLEKLHSKGFKDAKIIEEFSGINRSSRKRHEDRELLIIK